mmetsp:Transcript_111054/g.313226  ORF Transcript_111054/g.313226 Transcript_111054/m.313226 type:complete len:216 (-) Transcript_111054:564-1211(-)
MFCVLKSASFLRHSSPTTSNSWSVLTPSAAKAHTVFVSSCGPNSPTRRTTHSETRWKRHCSRACVITIAQTRFAYSWGLKSRPASMCLEATTAALRIKTSFSLRSVAVAQQMFVNACGWNSAIKGTDNLLISSYKPGGSTLSVAMDQAVKARSMHVNSRSCSWTLPMTESSSTPLWPTVANAQTVPERCLVPKLGRFRSTCRRAILHRSSTKSPG